MSFLCNECVKSKKVSLECASCKASHSSCNLLAGQFEQALRILVVMAHLNDFEPVHVGVGQPS